MRLPRRQVGLDASLQRCTNPIERLPNRSVRPTDGACYGLHGLVRAIAKFDQLPLCGRQPLQALVEGLAAAIKVVKLLRGGRSQLI